MRVSQKLLEIVLPKKYLNIAKRLSQKSSYLTPQKYSICNLRLYFPENIGKVLGNSIDSVGRVGNVG